MINPEDKERFLEELEGTICALESKVGERQFVRPFVCDGALTSCDVFIIGVNPREDMAFGPFWDGRNFAKGNWESEYRRQRYARTGNESPSPTRRKLNLIREGASPTNALETNLYPFATSTERILSRDPASQNDAIFALLLNSLRPRVVVTHGTTSRDRVMELLELQKSEAQEVLLDMKELPNDPAKFIKARSRAWGDSPVVYLKALRHLGRNYSYEFMRQIGERVREIAVEAAVSIPNSNRH